MYGARIAITTQRYSGDLYKNILAAAGIVWLALDASQELTGKSTPKLAI